MTAKKQGISAPLKQNRDPEIPLECADLTRIVPLHIIKHPADAAVRQVVEEAIRKAVARAELAVAGNSSVDECCEQRQILNGNRLDEKCEQQTEADQGHLDDHGTCFSRQASGGDARERNSSSFSSVDMEEGTKQTRQLAADEGIENGEGTTQCPLCIVC